FPQAKIKGGNLTSFFILPMATIDDGYALIYANSTNETVNNSFFTRGSVYANFITYNNTFQNRTILLYTFTNNITFNAIFCDIVSVGVGQVCTLSINNAIVNNITKEYKITKEFIRIYFLTSGSVLKVLSNLDLPNITTFGDVNWIVNSMPFGINVITAVAVFIYLAIPTKEQTEKMIEGIVGDAKEKINDKIDEVVSKYIDDAANSILKENNRSINEGIDGAQEKVINETDKIFEGSDGIKKDKNTIIEKIGNEIKKNLIDKTDKMINEIDDDIKIKIIDETKKYGSDIEEEIIKKIDEIIANFNNINKMNEEFGGAAKEIIEKFDNIKKKMNEEFGGDAKEIINKKFKKIGREIEKILNEANKKLKEAKQGRMKKIINKLPVSDEEDSSNEDTNEIINKVFEKIPEYAPRIIKNSFNDGNLYDNSVNEISKKIQSRFNDKRSEIFQQISKKSSYTPFMDNILSVETSTEIKTQLTKDTKGLQLNIEIHLVKEISSIEIKSIIFAKIHTEIAIILLQELLNILLEKFFIQLQEKLPAKIRNIKEFEDIIKEKTSINKYKAEEISTKISIEFSTEISKKIKEEISNKVQEEISNTIQEEISNKIQEEIENYFYKTLNTIHESDKVEDEDKLEISNGQEASNEGKDSSEKNSKSQEPEEQKIAKEIQNHHFTITYEIDEIKNLFHKTMDEKLDIKTAEKNKLVKSLNDILNNDVNKEVDMEHIIFIIFAIFDSESLIFLDNIVDNYAKKVKKNYNDLKTNSKTHDPKSDNNQKSDYDNNDENNDNKIERYIKWFIIIRVLFEIIFKHIPLIIIMAVYASSIVIYSYMPFMALITITSIIKISIYAFLAEPPQKTIYCESRLCKKSDTTKLR
ncbi:28377_t:CDS:2, partial [Dentiscutata erythropus]